MSNPFDYVNSINDNKKDLMTGTENDQLAEKGYEPFMTNRALSYHQDTVGLANEMNIRWESDKKMQYHFLLNSVRRKKRFAKWHKKDHDGDVALVKEYYGYNESKAQQALTILTDHDIEELRKRMYKGGKNA